MDFSKKVLITERKLEHATIMNPIIPFEPVRSDQIPIGDNWIYQVKWDGVRILVYRNDDGIRLFNRKKHERTEQYPELIEPGWASTNSFIADGEVIALASDGKPSFHEVMRRDGIRRLERIPQVRQEVGIVYMIFDLLFLDGEWITHYPSINRQKLLRQTVTPNAAYMWSIPIKTDKLCSRS